MKAFSKPKVLRILSAALPALAAPSAARAVILDASDDPDFNTTAPTGTKANSGWQWEGPWLGNYLATPIGPHHFVSAKHIGGNVGVPFYFNGNSYTVTSVTSFGDINLFTVGETFYTYAPLYDTADEFFHGSAVVIGRGTQRGATVSVNSVNKGWQWGADDNKERWGTNQVAGFAIDTNNGNNPLIRFDFNHIGGNEATLSRGDSGGATFLNVNGVWKLAGINYAVDGPFRTSAGGPNIDAAIYDTTGMYDSDGNAWPANQPVSRFYTTRVSSFYSSINSLLALPPTWKTDGDSNWSTASNWAHQSPSGSAPGGIDAEADFRTAITAPRTVSLTSGQTVGTLDIEGSSTAWYTLAGSTLTLDVSSGSAGVNVTTGSHVISAPLTLNDATTFNIIDPAASLNLTGALTATNQAVTKIGAGTLMVKNILSSTLSAQDGTVSVAADGGSAGTSIVNTLTIAGGTNAWAAKVDLTNNDLIIRATPANRAAAYAAAYNQIKTAINGAGGPWTGNGITSSTAAADTNLLYAVGIISNDDSQFGGAGGPLYPTFSGQTADANAILIKSTYFGDANLDGTIDITDYSLIDTEFNSHLADGGWLKGDFDYSGGTIDISDYFLIDHAFGSQGGSLTPAMSASSRASLPGVSAVPEPGSLALLAAGAAALLRRRARRGF